MAARYRSGYFVPGGVERLSHAEALATGERLHLDQVHIPKPISFTTGVRLSIRERLGASSQAKRSPLSCARIVPSGSAPNEAFWLSLCNYWCRLRGLNSRPSVYKTAALPLS